jgi:hypothetical protein
VVAIDLTPAFVARLLVAEPGPYLKRVLALELVELDELQGIFHDKAVAEIRPGQWRLVREDCGEKGDLARP